MRGNLGNQGFTHEAEAESQALADGELHRIIRRVVVPVRLARDRVDLDRERGPLIERRESEAAERDGLLVARVDQRDPLARLDRLRAPLDRERHPQTDLLRTA